MPGPGRPPRTSAREIEVAALDLFSRYGFDATTVENAQRILGKTAIEVFNLR